MPRKLVTNASDNAKKVTVVISDNLNGRFDVIEKALPADLPNTHNKKAITWVANFGFKPKPNQRVSASDLDQQGFMRLLDEAYDIEFDREGVTKVYFDGSQVREWHAGIKLGDPPVGFT